MKVENFENGTRQIHIEKLSKKLAVFVPGRNYSTDCPLLYYADFVFETRGYERKSVRFSETAHDKSLSLDELLLKLQPEMELELENADFQSYDEIVFVSKSIGTALAGWYTKKYHIPARHIYMTPIPQTLTFLKSEGRENNRQTDKPARAGETCMVVAGTNDRYLEASVLEKLCREEGIPCKQYPGAGHSMEVDGQWKESLRILEDVMNLCEKF